MAGSGSAAQPGAVADEAYIRALYAEHGGALLRYALHLTGGDRQRAEDLVQETVVRAWRHPEALADRPARPWLFAVARNLAVDAYRARQSRPPEVGQAALELVPAADDADRALESWAVADALAALRPDHRRVIIETYYRGCSVAEAAATLGIPSGTVKSRTFYALKALKLPWRREDWRHDAGWDCTDTRQALGVYVLGAIDPAERSQVDRHITGCRECRDELAGLAGLPALLSRVSADEVGRISGEDAEPVPAGAAPPEDFVESVLSLTAARRRRNRRWQAVAAAAAVVIAAAGAVAGFRLSSSPAPASQSPPPHAPRELADSPDHQCAERHHGHGPVQQGAMGHGDGHPRHRRARRDDVPAVGDRRAGRAPGDGRLDGGQRCSNGLVPGLVVGGGRTGAGFRCDGRQPASSPHSSRAEQPRGMPAAVPRLYDMVRDNDRGTAVT